MHVHFIAIGGAAMHNLAIALSRKGDTVTGSDDAIYDPSRSRLEREGLLPPEMGWHPERIHEGLDAVIVGMHARANNPELARAQAQGLPTYSYPEYLFNATQHQKRVVIGGSHGKTSTTAMILHVLAKVGIDADYMVGAQLDGFDCMVKLSDAPVAVLEGDEYLASPLDRRPKFHLYRPHVAVITGIAWDHVNVFPTWENYVEQFDLFAQTVEPGGRLFVAAEDPEAAAVLQRNAVEGEAYGIHPHHIDNGYTYLHTAGGDQRIEVFGNHNLQNLNAARLACREIGVAEADFYAAIASFPGASRRLERMVSTPETMIFRDFAHSPSKVKATTEAVKQQYPERTLVAAFELHTFSSLNADFLREYRGAMDAADLAWVCWNPDAVAHKKLPPISKSDIEQAFARQGLQVFEHPSKMVAALKALDFAGKNVLVMTSGDLGGIDLPSWAQTQV